MTSPAPRLPWLVALACGLLSACGSGGDADPCGAQYETPATFETTLATELQAVLDANLAATGAPGATLTVHVPRQGTFAGGCSRTPRASSTSPTTLPSCR